MTDQIRAALFSSLAERVVGARMLDLYAGSGAVGIEALSRGAAHATFVERNPGAVRTIRENLRLTGFEDRASVVSARVEDFLAQSSERAFDIVMVDPPFSVGLPSGVLEGLTEGFLGEEAVVIARVAARLEPAVAPAPLAVEARRRYGDSLLLYLRARKIVGKGNT
jgi:16S rRNA (guanine966-N2)-methyltransferase